MNKTMIIATNPQNNATAHIVINSSKLNEMLECLSACGAESKTFEQTQMPLNELPEEVQKEVKATLKVFHNANVTFEYNRFEVSAHTCIKAKYNYDHFVCGRYNDTEVYTEEERRQNLAELNKHEFPEWAW